MLAPPFEPKHVQVQELPDPPLTAEVVPAMQVLQVQGAVEVAKDSVSVLHCPSTGAEV